MSLLTPARRALEAPRTAAEAIDAYGRHRLERCDPDWHPAVESALEIIAAFCDEYGPELLDPLSRRRVERRGGPARPGRHLLEPQHLGAVLVPCARVFPFQIVAGLGVLEGFRLEVPLLWRWLRRHGLLRAASAGAFPRQWSCARPTLDRHRDAQRAIEDALALCPVRGDGEVLVGRFLVVHATSIGIWVRATDEEHGPVRVPPELAKSFREGDEVSLACERAVVGWRVLAAALPCRPGHIEELLRG